MSKTSHLIQFLNGNDYVIGMILPKDAAISHKSHDTHRRHIRHIQCSISNDVHKTDRQIPIKTYGKDDLLQSCSSDSSRQSNSPSQ